MILTIANQEIRTLLKSPGAWVILAIVQCLLGLSYLLFIHQYSHDINEIVLGVFKISLYLILFVVPVICIRIISVSQKDPELGFLLCKPVKQSHIVIGKFLGIIIYTLCLQGTSLVLVLSLLIGGQLDAGMILTVIAGILICTCSFVAINFYLCSITSAPLFAVVAAILMLLFFMFIELFTNTGMYWLDQSLLSISLFGHMNNIFKGLISSADLLFYLLTSVLFLYLTHTRLQDVFG